MTQPKTCAELMALPEIGTLTFDIITLPNGHTARRPRATRACVVRYEEDTVMMCGEWMLTGNENGLGRRRWL